jgi:adenylosuccinate synthase
MDKTGRNGLRVGDIFSPNFQEKYDALVEKHIGILKHFEGFEYNLSHQEQSFFESIDAIRELKAVDSEHFLNQALKEGKRILAEGAQGTMLDIDFGTYPFVTSSNTITAGTCTGLGIAPTKIGKVIGIMKAYCTRVGSGPFPTELLNETGEQMRQEGREFGSTTGRARRCGWVDLPQLKYAIMINGVTELCIMKADVLGVFDHIDVCTHYKINGETIDYFPYDTDGLHIEPVYQSFPGWKKDLTNLGNYNEAPEELQSYIQFLEQALEVPVRVVSVGPDRQQTLTL